MQGHVDFVFPATKRHPKGQFFYENSSRFVTFTFKNGGFAYEIEEQLVGPTTVRVLRAGKLAADFECSNASRTLMHTDIINILSEAGISTR